MSDWLYSSMVNILLNILSNVSWWSLVKSPGKDNAFKALQELCQTRQISLPTSSNVLTLSPILRKKRIALLSGPQNGVAIETKLKVETSKHALKLHIAPVAV